VQGILRSVAIAVLMAGNTGWAQSTIQPQDRLREAITENEMVTLVGNVHPAVAHDVSTESVDASFPMEHMILLLRPDLAQETALDQLAAQRQDPRSPQYRKFLSTDQYGARFGAPQNDVVKITGWLSRHGFRVEEVTANRLSIVFSGEHMQSRVPLRRR
jgi:subtilase family serine protease